MKTNEARYCKRCGNRVYPSGVKGYRWECLYCDEDFYNFETLSLDDKYKEYEALPLAKYFWSQSGDYPQCIGEPFKIVEREVQNPEYESLSWVIEFRDGFRIWAYPDEIFLPIMKDNGYTGE